MRKMSIVMGCVAVIALAGSSNAGVEFRFSRPNTGYDAFQSDQHSCKLAATTLKWSHAAWYRGGSAVDRHRSIPVFLRCMTGKGYRLDPNGYRTGRMRIEI